ncbi:MAG TPA: sigma-54 dependent transcriptional regulator [archaeon]|nr:sigma-54 dependent transcriptional regulator [archaeon]
MSQKILVVDDEKTIRNILTTLLTDETYTVLAAGSGEESIAVVDSFEPDLILMDQRMPGVDGIEALVRIKEKRPEVTVIILTAHASIELAVEAIKKGAYDYLSKPFDNEELLIIIRRALERNRLAGEITQLKKQLQDKYSFKNIIGVSANMHRVFEQIARVCETNATVLVQGESGTGKELVARAIHYNSRRKDKPFVTINCGAIPVSLIESELFGYERGAFTGARDRTIGKFEQAHCGTFLLDEIGELSLEAQVKLLRVLDEQKITRLGGREPILIDVRLIAATNKDLQEEVDQGSFRLDLFYRLNIVTIRVPSLVERKEDIPLLVEHFIQKYNSKLGLKIKGISSAAMDYLQNYSWPGNVRDLENAVQSAMIHSQSDVVSVEDLPLRIYGYSEVYDKMDLEAAGLEEYVKRLTTKIEKDLIKKTMTKCGNNRSLAAKELQISRKTLYNKLKTFRLL